MSVIKVSTKPAVEVTAFHIDVYRIAMTGVKATQTVAQRMLALVTSRYGSPTGSSLADKNGNSAQLTGSTGPTFEQYKADLAALDAIAKQRKLADGQWLRRPYGAALKALYKELPVSMAPDAVAKRQQREANEKIARDAIAKAMADGTAPTVGAPKGETQERQPSEGEQLEQLIARIGVFETLYACLRILDSDDATKAQVVHLRKMADKAKDASAKADAAARLAAIKPTADAK